MSNNDLVVANALGVEWASWTRQDDFPLTSDHCINGTRLAIDVLAHFAVKATPLSVSIIIFNTFGWDLFLAGVPAAKWPEHAHSIGVGPGAQPDRPGHWPGHLVTEGDSGWWLDLSAMQFDRPGKIHLPLPLLVVDPIPELPMGSEIHINHGLVVHISRWPDNDAWQEASGWLRPMTKERDLMIERVTRRLERQ